MFSSLNNGVAVGASTPASSTRSRRRPRPVSNDDSLRQPKTKRPRIPLNEQTFANPEVNQDNSQTKPTRSSAAARKQERAEDVENTSPPAVRKELSFRSKKAKTADRLNKGDGSVVLTSNNAFIVSKLPALPDRLRADAQSRQHGLLDPSSGYALSLTHTHAVVWPYSASSPSPESFTFALPYPSKHSSDPLPLGSLVPPSAASSEPGLVVVMPTSGKITYWESISSATTLDFIRQQRNGVEDSVSGMWSSESVIQIASAEAAAGFVLAFSSGRIAYMSVRDAHGKPAITVNFLRTSLGPSTGGIFGSLRHLVSNSSIQGEIAAIRSDKSSRQGEQTVVAATVKGRLHAWKIHRGGHHDLLTEYDARDAIFNAISEYSPDSKVSPDGLRLHDLAFVPKDLEIKYSDMSQLRKVPESIGQEHFLVLASLTSKASKNALRYYLVEVILPQGASLENPITIGTIRPITSYMTPPEPHALAKPRLYLPRPGVVAFLVFGRATVIASLAKAPASPDSQLRFEDNHILPPTYEDVIDLRADPTLEVVASGIEEPQASGSEESRTYRIKVKNPSAVLLVRGTGTLRVATTDIERFASEKPPSITPKSKLEQAVFFGIKDDNPLVFDVPRELPFSDKELADAALELSQDILNSNNPHLPTLAGHLENNMHTRVKALEKLIVHLNSLKVKLDRATKWELLWNAEKLQAARFVWAKHEKFIQERPEDSKKDLVTDIVYYIRDEEKNQPDVAKGEVDSLRHWFIHDTFRMNIFLAWAYEVIKYQSKAKAENSVLTRLIYEAVEVMNGALRDAMEFRKRHLTLYGLSGEKLANGILADDYANLPNPWTSDQFIANNLKRLVELSSEWVNSESYPAQTDLDKSLFERIRNLLPNLTEVYLTSLQELSRWALASDNPNNVKLGETFEETYENDRNDKILLLAQSENWTAAYKLAEEHRALSALAQVLITEEQDCKAKLDHGSSSPEEDQRLHDLLGAKAKQLHNYLEKYGKGFAYPYYEHLIDICGVEAVLQENGDRRYKTIFLRTYKSFAKVSWINDIVQEDDIVAAGNTLVDLGLNHEQQLWNKKIELSLGKLARMAEASRPSSKASMSVQEANINAVTTEVGLEAIDQELAIIRIQNRLYEQIQPVLKTALDESAQLTVIADAFAPKIPKKYKILRDVFESGVARLLKHQALDPFTLIDILTLIQFDPDFKQAMPDQFFEALEVAHYGIKDPARREHAEKLIWRRCLLREEWTKINNTSLKGDNDIWDVLSHTDLFQVFCVLYTIQHESEPRNYRRWLPSEVVGVYTDSLDKHYNLREKSFREKLLEAMQWEDSNLSKHIEKHRLDYWSTETRRMAEEAVRGHVDQQTVDGATSPIGQNGNVH